jgi:4-carboxymuconolactone decarboxylase
MKQMIAILLSLLLLASISALASEGKPNSSSVASSGEAQAIRITRKDSQQPTQGSAEHFTGSVRIDAPFRGEAPARVYGASVTFEAGARTDWHSHALGQTLIVTEGKGLIQRWGDPVEVIRLGDVVWIPPGQKHWHGAAPDSAMTHIAIVEHLDGKSTEWMEKVTDEQYQG